MPRPGSAASRLRPESPADHAVVDAARTCLASRVDVAALILFGSRARGDALDVSDWDLAVVSPDFADLNPIQRGLRVLDCLAPGVDLVYLTPDELRHPEMNYLRCAILEEGEAMVDGGAFAEARREYEAKKASGAIAFRGQVVEFR